MERFTVTFYDETIKEIKELTVKNGSPSIAHCIRELVELGIKVKKASEKSAFESNENDLLSLLSELKNLLKNNLGWSLETRLLARFLIETDTNMVQEKQMEILKKCRETAQNYIKGLYQEVIE